MDEALLAELLEKLGAAKSLPAAELLELYGGLGPLLDEESGTLEALTGLSRDKARLLTLIPELARYTAREEAEKLRKLNSYDRACAYLGGLYLGARREQVYLLCLDKAGCLLDCTRVLEGSVEQVSCPPRRLLESALSSGAHALILSHNHPGGTPGHSAGDIEYTLQLLEILRPLGILLLDHIVSADGRCASIHNHPGLPGGSIFHGQPKDPLIAGWLPPKGE